MSLLSSRLDAFINPEAISGYRATAYQERLRKKVAKLLVKQRERHEALDELTPVMALCRAGGMSIKDMQKFGGGYSELTLQQMKTIGKHLKVRPNWMLDGDALTARGKTK